MWRSVSGGRVALRAVAVGTGRGAVTHRASPLSTRTHRARRRMRLRMGAAENAGTQADDEALTCVWVDGSNLADMSVDRLEALYTQVGRDSTHPDPCELGAPQGTDGRCDVCREPPHCSKADLATVRTVWGNFRGRVS